MFVPTHRLHDQANIHKWQRFVKYNSRGNVATTTVDAFLETPGYWLTWPYVWGNNKLQWCGRKWSWPILSITRYLSESTREHNAEPRSGYRTSGESSTQGFWTRGRMVRPGSHTYGSDCSPVAPSRVRRTQPTPAAAAAARTASLSPQFTSVLQECRC